MSANVLDLAAARRARAPADLADILDSMLASCEAIQAALARQEADREERQRAEVSRRESRRQADDAYKEVMISWRGLPFGPSTKKVFCEAGITFPVAVELVAAHADDDGLIRECAEHWKRHNSQSYAHTGVGYASVEKLRAYLATQGREEATA